MRIGVGIGLAYSASTGDGETPSQYTLVSITDSGGAAMVTAAAPITDDIDGHFVWIYGANGNYRGMWGPVENVSGSTFTLGDGTYDGNASFDNDSTWTDAGHRDEVMTWLESFQLGMNNGDPIDGAGWYDQSGNENEPLGSGSGTYRSSGGPNDYPFVDLTGGKFTLAGLAPTNAKKYGLLCLFRAGPAPALGTKVAVSWGSGGTPTVWMGYNDNLGTGHGEFVVSESHDDLYDGNAFRRDDTNWHLGIAVRNVTPFVGYDQSTQIGSVASSGEDNGTTLTIGDYPGGGFAGRFQLVMVMAFDLGLGSNRESIIHNAWVPYVVWRYGLPVSVDPAPQPPTVTLDNPTAESIDVTTSGWTGSKFIRVWGRSPAGSGSWVDLVEGGYSASSPDGFTWSGLSAGTTAEVRATLADTDSSPQSDYSDTETETTLLPAPANFAAVWDTIDTTTLSWDAVPGAAVFFGYRYGTDNPPSNAESGSPVGTAAASAGITYYVAAVDDLARMGEVASCVST